MKKNLGIFLGMVLVISFSLVTAGLAVADPDSGKAKLLLENKDPTTWQVIDDDMYATLTYKKAGPAFEYKLHAHGLLPETDYSLIYYADKPNRFTNWGGDYPGAFIASGTTNIIGDLKMHGCCELNMDLPCPPDANYQDGAKIWLVPSSDYDATNFKMKTYIPTQYLFEDVFITYDDTDVPAPSAMSSFEIDHAKIDFKDKPYDDKIHVKGELEVNDVDISECVIVCVGSLRETFKMEEKGRENEKWEYKRSKCGTGNIKHVKINWNNGKFDIRMDKADLSEWTDHNVTISIQIGNDIGTEAIWMLDVMMMKGKKWEYKAPNPPVT